MIKEEETGRTFSSDSVLLTSKMHVLFTRQQEGWDDHTHLVIRIFLEDRRADGYALVILPPPELGVGDPDGV